MGFFISAMLSFRERAYLHFRYMGPQSLKLQILIFQLESTNYMLSFSE